MDRTISNSIGLSDKDKLDIKKQRKAGMPLKNLALNYGVSISTVWKLVNGVRK